MTSRLNHVKLVTSQPEVVDAFLTQVCAMPEGWPLGDVERLSSDAPLGPGGELDPRFLDERRTMSAANGFIVGDTGSRQLQVLTGEPASFWAACISTRDLEGVYERARARGVPCTPITTTEWTDRDRIAYFFCLVADLVWEVIRVEPRASNQRSVN